MKYIPAFNIAERYRAEANSRRDEYTPKTIGHLLDAIERESNPFDFREQLFAITQHYSDGLIAGKKVKRQKRQQHAQHRAVAGTARMQALDALIQAGKNVTGSFYSGEGVACDAVRELFLPYAADIFACSDKGHSKIRHLNRMEYYVQNFGFKMQGALESMLHIPETLVCVASGGLEPSYLLMHICEKDDILVLRYSRTTRNDEVVESPYHNTQRHILPKIKKKEVLVIEDYVYTGKSIFGALHYIVTFQPKSLYGVTVMSQDKGPFLCTRNQGILNFSEEPQNILF